MQDQRTFTTKNEILVIEERNENSKKPAPPRGTAMACDPKPSCDSQVSRPSNNTNDTVPLALSFDVGSPPPAPRSIRLASTKL